LADNSLEITPNEFFEIKNVSLSGRRGQKILSQYNFTGVYILFNKSENMYYIGHGTKVLARINSHFTGAGNKDVYDDYKYGDEFSIKMISLANSPCASLNELKQSVIATYDAHASRYNKTRDNQ